MEETEENEILPEDMIADDSQMTPEPTMEPTPQPDPLEAQEQIAQIIAETKLGISHYESLYSALAGDCSRSTEVYGDSGWGHFGCGLV